MEGELLLSAKGVCKAFGPTRALIDVDIEIRRGEIRGLIGENGSGKSTLSSIIAGAQKEDSGEFWFKGEKYHPTSMVDAQNKGISMIIQEAGTIPKITVASNIFAGRLEQFYQRGFLNWKKINDQANAILEGIGAGDIRADAMIDTLNFEDRKIVEIARALVNDVDVLIIDETTTALAQKGRTIIYNLIRRFHERNKAVLFISHDLDELMEVCNTITVLRDGVIIDTLDRSNMSIELMRKLMVGRDLSGSYFRSDYDGSHEPEVVLEAKQISLRGAFENIDIQLHRGEILGLGGLSNCGMHEVGRAMFGVEKLQTGTVTLNRQGKSLNVKSAYIAVENGMAYVSKDRDREAIILNGSIGSNISLPSMAHLTGLMGSINRKREKQIISKQVDFMRIKCRNPRQMVKELSGGNKQKVVFSKWLARESDVLILDCPTRGIDVGVKADMYHLMTELKKEGKAILLISEELLELIGMSDRMLIMKDGRIMKEIIRHPDVSEKDIINYMI